MSVGEFCNREVVVAGKDTSISEAATLMRSFHVGDLVILEDGDERRPIGLVSDRDIVVEVIAAGLNPDAVTVTDIMTEPLETVTSDTDVWDALAAMRIRAVRRLPIVGEDGALEGILTLDDALELIGEAVANLVALVSREIAHETQRRDRVLAPSEDVSDDVR